MPTLIVPLDTLKRALGISLTDTSGDTALTELENRMAEWVEGRVKRRFSAPIDRVDYQLGSGRQVLYLKGHLAGPEDPEDTEFVYVVVQERYRGGAWMDVDASLFERRDDSIVRLDGWCWSSNAEYKTSYKDGYWTANTPKDVQDLVIELIIASRLATEEGAGITSEKIGDYSYSIDTSAVKGLDSLSDTSLGTLNRYQKRFV